MSASRSSSKRRAAGLPLCLALGRLKTLALATGEVATARQFCVFVHRSVHSNVNAFRVAAAASLNARVVHGRSASSSPGMAATSGSRYFLAVLLTVYITVTWPRQSLGPLEASNRSFKPAPTTAACTRQSIETLVIFKGVLAAAQIPRNSRRARLFPAHNPESHRRADEPRHERQLERLRKRPKIVQLRFGDQRQLKDLVRNVP